jgi:glucose-6-phosphate dehydrogenase assembly protein OpcA
MIRLEDTSGSAVVAAIAAERHRQGSPTTGMVLTMLILSDEEMQSDATSAAVTAAREHPMRIVTLIPRPGRAAPTLDAEIAVGGDDGPGEVAVLRLRGELSHHANSVAVPLLLPDTPVVAFWPSNAPDIPADDPIGKHAQRRITDSATCEDPLAGLAERARGYRPGDTDLAWSRLTPWRSIIASAFDRPVKDVQRARIVAETGNPSAALLRVWLMQRLTIQVSIDWDSNPGISSVAFDTAHGELSITRTDRINAILKRPDSPDASIYLPRRDLATLLSEELKRLDPDDVYGAVIREFGRQQ